MEAWAKYLKNTWGLNASFADRVALFINWLNYYGLNPSIRSGFRDPEKQKAMRALWDRGQRAGLRARPAVDSLHTVEHWSNPDARAIDITTRDDSTASRIARALGIGTGLDFRDPDPGHYFDLTSRA